MKGVRPECAWSDFSPAAQTARWALDNATGITVPDRSFIVWVVVGYICILCAELAFVPPHRPCGMGVDRGAADRHRLYGGRSTSGPIEYRVSR